MTEASDTFLDAMSEWERRVFPKLVNATDVHMKGWVAETRVVASGPGSFPGGSARDALVAVDHGDRHAVSVAGPTPTGSPEGASTHSIARYGVSSATP